jgi:PKD repeat protein
VDNFSPTVDIEYSEPDPYRDVDIITIMAVFNEGIAGTLQIAIDYAGTGSDVSPMDMTSTGDNKIWSYEADIPPENDGTAIITITGSDEAGNPVGTHKENTFEVDNTEPDPPVITTNEGNDYSTVDSAIILEGTCPEDTVAIYVNGSSEGVTYTPGETSWSYDGPLTAGENEFEVTDEDTAENMSDLDSITITGCRPYTPILVSPSGGEEDVQLMPQLQTDAFSHPCDSTHEMTGWQISTERDFSSRLLDISSKHLTSLSVPHSVLDEGTMYYWRVIFYDNHLVASDSSDGSAFTTSIYNRDNNGNGVPDDQECDDITNQDKQKCVKTTAGDGEIEISSTASSVKWLESIDPETISDTSNRPENLPFGLVTFKLMVNDQGETTDLTVDLSRATSDEEALAEFFEIGSWYAYDTINGWQDYSDDAAFYPEEKPVVLSLTDGGTGDADGTKNRIIVDPSGLGAGNIVPEASFTVDPTSGEEPLRVHFDATGSKDFDGEIISYDWNFGDGSTAFGETTSHEYSSKGTYTVELTVTDDDGMTDEATAVISVREKDEPCSYELAVSGSPLEPFLTVLRDFRDRILKLIPGGDALIDLYYASSPSVANVLKAHETLRTMVRWSLVPVVGMTWMALHYGLWVTMAALVVVIFLMAASAVIVTERIRLRHRT